MYTLTEQLSNVDIRKDNLLENVQSLQIPDYKVVKDKSGTKFVVYVVRIRSGDVAWELERRYNEFHQLHDRLAAVKAAAPRLPSLPPKRMFGGFSRDFLEKRRADLEQYLQNVIFEPVLLQQDLLRDFLWYSHKMLTAHGRMHPSQRDAAASGFNAASSGAPRDPSSSSASSAASSGPASSPMMGIRGATMASQNGPSPAVSMPVGDKSSPRKSIASTGSRGSQGQPVPDPRNVNVGTVGSLGDINFQGVGDIIDFAPNEADDEEESADSSSGRNFNDGEGDARSDSNSNCSSNTASNNSSTNQNNNVDNNNYYNHGSTQGSKDNKLFVDTDLASGSGGDHTAAGAQTGTSTASTATSDSRHASPRHGSTPMRAPRPPASAPPVKKPSLDDFEMVRVLGKGSFGKVLLCKKRDTGKLYAIKVLKKQHVVKRRQVVHTKTERSVLGLVDHPFVVKLHYAFQTGDKLHFVLDFCSGGELFFHLGRAGRFNESLGRFYAAEIALALGHLHKKGVVYRDLKPENILLDAEGHIKLADFGLSKEGIVSGIRGTHSFCGTPEYLAPEVLNRHGHGTSVDWWSLGALLYEMLTGLPPWYSQDRQKMFACIRSSELRFPEFVSSLAQLILTDLLERDVTKRLGSSRDVDEVKEHPFFQFMDWDKLYRREIPSPFVPRLSSQTDTGNFDSQFTRLPINSIDASSFVGSPRNPGVLSSSVMSESQTHFDNFTFAEPSTLAAHMQDVGSLHSHHHGGQPQPSPHSGGFAAPLSPAGGPAHAPASATGLADGILFE
ncbi:Protein kinase, putative [Hondaea fermentalgiana]|uniref:Protein kinase, putative n=1 Tax=Hondaea fermentalgiana TaxID=2315210 RepID=A0A2R5FYZ6_9STRA|nr:Protein kinase, putative [Hondaea fermentalgiana]|eukprot:GBG23950.1 Protein kinase, putative [Hondaea fermentalgiana]